MKKSVLCAVAAMGLGFGALAAPAKAADFGIFGSYQDTKDAGHGYGGGVKLDFGHFVTLRATYLGDITSGTRFSNGDDLKLRVVPLEAGLQYKWTPDAPFSPYLGGGASYFVLNPNHGNTNNELGWFAMAGADIKTPHGFGIMLEGIYRSVDATVHNNTFSSSATVRTRRAPLAPMGWPSATAPPLTLTRSSSSSSMRVEFKATAANASLISTRSRSFLSIPAFSTARLNASAGTV